MPRKKTFTLVRIEDGEMIADRYESPDAVRDAIAALPADVVPLLFNAQAIGFTVVRKPQVVLGGSAPARGKKPAAPRTRKKPALATGTRFNGDGSRVVDTDPESPPAPAPEQQPDVEA